MPSVASVQKGCNSTRRPWLGVSSKGVPGCEKRPAIFLSK